MIKQYRFVLCLFLVKIVFKKNHVVMPCHGISVGNRDCTCVMGRYSYLTISIEELSDYKIFDNPGALVSGNTPYL